MSCVIKPRQGESLHWQKTFNTLRRSHSSLPLAACNGALGGTDLLPDQTTRRLDKLGILSATLEQFQCRQNRGEKLAGTVVIGSNDGHFVEIDVRFRQNIRYSTDPARRPHEQAFQGDGIATAEHAELIAAASQHSVMRAISPVLSLM